MYFQVLLTEMLCYVDFCKKNNTLFTRKTFQCGVAMKKLFMIVMLGLALCAQAMEQDSAKKRKRVDQFRESVVNNMNKRCKQMRTANILMSFNAAFYQIDCEKEDELPKWVSLFDDYKEYVAKNNDKEKRLGFVPYIMSLLAYKNYQQVTKSDEYYDQTKGTR